MNASDKGIQDWKESTWRIYLKLDMPSFKFPVIQWAIFNEDPVILFKSSSKELQEVYQKHMDEIEQIE